MQEVNTITIRTFGAKVVYIRMSAMESQAVPLENRGRGFWQFLGKWQFVCILAIWLFCLQTLAIFNVFVHFLMFFSPPIIEIDFFLIYKKAKKQIPVIITILVYSKHFF